MKKSLLVVSTHSFVDLITNSSTELFVCDSDKTLVAMKELLGKLLSFHDELSNTQHNFDEVFGRIFVTPYGFNWYQVSDPVRDKYQYYHGSRFERDDGYYPSTVKRSSEVEQLEDAERYLRRKYPREENLYETNRPEYDRLWKLEREEIDALWSDYGSRSMEASGDLFIEFLKQNEVPAEWIEQAHFVIADAVENHKKNKEGQYPSRLDFDAYPLLKEAYEFFHEWESWGITAKKGSIFIYSADDNSIPYGLFGTVESYLNAKRWHLG